MTSTGCRLVPRRRIGETSVKPAIGVAGTGRIADAGAGRGAETVVPPGNSAATQYTEAFPTAGGNAKADGRERNGGSPTQRSSARSNAHKLESKGPVGEEVATLSGRNRTASSRPAPQPAPAHAQGRRAPPRRRRTTARRARQRAAAPAAARARAPRTPRSASERLLRLRRGARPGDRLQLGRAGDLPAADRDRHRRSGRSATSGAGAERSARHRRSAADGCAPAVGCAGARDAPSCALPRAGIGPAPARRRRRRGCSPASPTSTPTRPPPSRTSSRPAAPWCSRRCAGT